MISDTIEQGLNRYVANNTNVRRVGCGRVLRRPPLRRFVDTRRTGLVALLHTRPCLRHRPSTGFLPRTASSTSRRETSAWNPVKDTDSRSSTTRCTSGSEGSPSHIFQTPQDEDTSPEREHLTKTMMQRRHRPQPPSWSLSDRLQLPQLCERTLKNRNRTHLFRHQLRRKIRRLVHSASVIGLGAPDIEQRHGHGADVCGRCSPRILT